MTADRRLGFLALVGSCLLVSSVALAQPTQEEPPEATPTPMPEATLTPEPTSTPIATPPPQQEEPTPVPSPAPPPDLAPPAPPRTLQIVEFSMTSGGGSSRLYEDGYESAATTILTHGRLRIGAVAGRSLGPSFTLEGGGTWQRPGELRCDDEPCDEPEPEGGVRFLGLVAARIGYEGRNAAIEGGVGMFRCPGCAFERDGVEQEPSENGAENARLILSVAARVGPPVFHVWGEYGAGGISAFAAPNSGFGERTPGAIGIGHTSRYADIRVGGTAHGWVGSVDVPVFEGMKVGAVAWGYEDQWAGGIRMTLPLGAGQRVGRAYRPAVRP